MYYWRTGQAMYEKEPVLSIIVEAFLDLTTQLTALQYKILKEKIGGRISDYYTPTQACDI